MPEIQPADAMPTFALSRPVAVFAPVLASLALATCSTDPFASNPYRLRRLPDMPFYRTTAMQAL